MKSVEDIGIKYGFDIQWNFFAEQHGKGAVDGIGAALKKIALNKIRTDFEIM
jgi:hypothetical protein